LSKKRRSPKESYDYQPPIEQEQELRTESKYRLKMAYTLDQDEVNLLIDASHAPYVELPSEVIHSTEYDTYSEDEVLSLLDGQPPRPRKRIKKKLVSETT